MPFVKFILESGEKLWRRRGTTQGLFLFALILNLVVAPSADSMSYLVLTKSGIVNSPADFARFVAWAVLAGSVANAALLGCWAWWRRVPKFSQKDVAVLFAPSSDPDCDDLVQRLYREFRNDLAGRHLPALVFDMSPTSRSVNGPQEAHRLLVESGARLVIYGTIRRAKRQSRVTEGFTTVSFAVRHRELSQEEWLPLAQEVAGALAPRTFSFEDENAFVERSVVIESLSQVARMFIGMALTVDGQSDFAVPILEELRVEVAAGQHRPGCKTLLNMVTRCLLDGLLDQYNRLYDAKVVDRITQPEASPYVDECARLLERISTLSGNGRQWDLSRGVFAFHNGRIQEARRLVRRAARLVPTAAEGYLSLAFLDLWEGRFVEAVANYKEASARVCHSSNSVFQVVRFLSSLVERHPELPQLRFGLAVVTDKFLDGETAQREYERFLAQTEKSVGGGWSALRGYAGSRLADAKAPGGAVTSMARTTP